MVNACCTTLPSIMVSTTSRNAGMLGELVFAVFELAARLEHQHAADEHIGLVDHALALQQIGDVADAEAARDVDDLVLSPADRALRSAACRNKDAAPSDDDEQDENGEDRVAGDDQRMARALGARARRRNAAPAASAARGERGSGLPPTAGWSRRHACRRQPVIARDLRDGQLPAHARASPFPTERDCHRRHPRPAPHSPPSRPVQCECCRSVTEKIMAKAGATAASLTPLSSGRSSPSAVIAAEDQRRIGAAEAERIRQRDVDVALARLVRHQIDRRLDRRIVEIDGRRRDAVADRQDREDRLDRAGRAEQMADRRTWSTTSRCGRRRCRPGAAPRRVRSRRRAASRCRAR